MLALVQRHGWNATSFQTLESGFSYFTRPSGCVAYVDTGFAWVAAGAPIAATDELGVVAEAFVEAAERAGRRACFFATEERFSEATAGAFRRVRIGSQPEWSPASWTQTLAERRSLREQLRRARAKGVRIREASAIELRDELTALVERWYATRSLAPMGFLVRVEPWTLPSERRCFVAEEHGRIVAFACVVPVPARNGWFVENLVRDPFAPNGTSELLVDVVMRWASERGSDWVTLGLAPLAGDVAPCLRLCRDHLSFLYDFQGLLHYKQKLSPSRWSPIFLCHPKTQNPVLTIVDSLAAFAPGGFLRFGVRSVLRGPRVLLAALALLLVPWTVALALSPDRFWFDSALVKWSWVAFDMALAVGLFHALRKPALALVTALALTVTFDAILTFTQAMVWNVPHLRTPVDALAILIACTAPALAAVVLWGTRSRVAILTLPTSR